jgi:hypothetical protein
MLYVGTGALARPSPLPKNCPPEQSSAFFLRIVILSAAATSRSEVTAESKDPCALITPHGCRREFSRARPKPVRGLAIRRRKLIHPTKMGKVEGRAPRANRGSRKA